MSRKMVALRSHQLEEASHEEIKTSRHQNIKRSTHQETASTSFDFDIYFHFPPRIVCNIELNIILNILAVSEFIGI